MTFNLDAQEFHVRPYFEKSIVAASSSIAAIGISWSAVEQGLRIAVLVAGIIGALAPVVMAWRASKKEQK